MGVDICFETEILISGELVVFTIPTFPENHSVNHGIPLGESVIVSAPLIFPAPDTLEGISYSVRYPLFGSSDAIAFPTCSLNHKTPFVSISIQYGSEDPEGGSEVEKVLIACVLGLNSDTKLGPCWVNHMFPSESITSPVG